MKTLPIALQVFSIREEAERDFVKTMQTVKDMGYDGVELAGLYGYTPDQIRDILKDIGLIPISAHVPYEAFQEDLQGTIQSYVTIGCRYVVIPYLLEDSRYGTDLFERFMGDVLVIAKACKAAGMTLLYHNHDFEFQKTDEGEYILDYIYRKVPSEDLKMELDTCWAKYSGVDPVAYLKKYHGRSPVVHLKDYNGKEPFEFRAVGHGVQDIPAILQESARAGADWVVVEQDEHTVYAPLEDVRISRVYLRELGW
jgi:sugar phosphate isomerase/epimerase